MRGVLISLPPAELQALKDGFRYVILSRPVRVDPQRALDVLFYSSRSSGGSGLVEGTGYVGQCFQFVRREYDCMENCYPYGVDLGDNVPSGRWYQEIIGFRILPEPIPPLEKCIGNRYANPPQKDWKYVQIQPTYDYDRHLLDFDEK